MQDNTVNMIRTYKCSGVFFLLLLLITVLFSSCSPKTAKSTLPMTAPDSFSSSGEHSPPDKWWRVFEDQKLNKLIGTALDSNFNLLTVWHRFKAAQAVVDREASFLLPDIETSMRGGITRPEPDFVGGENMRIGISAFYEVDLWGRIRSRVEAERYRAKASFADYQTVAISLSAEIARVWYQLMAEWHQLQLIEEQISTNEQILTLLRSRFGSGQIRSVDILRQKQLIKATQEQKISSEIQIKLLENQLAILSGVPPQNLTEYSIDTLPDLPPVPETGIPADLIQRRPDVQFAFYLLKAADRELASAISSQYPRFSISSSFSTRANNVEGLFNDWAYSLAGSLLAPIFYGGRLRAEVNRTEEVKKQRLYEYGQTILIALQEVEDALIQENKQLENIQVLEEQVLLAEKTYRQLRVEYFNGISDYLAVLTAIDNEQQLRRDLILAKLLLLEYRIALYRSLAGSFKTEREPES